MLAPIQLQFLKTMFEAAKTAGHRWPAAAACEACIETGHGAHVPYKSNNVLGIKATRSYTGLYVTANGTEQHSDGSYTGPELDRWRVYPDYASCFRDQMHVLQTQKEPDGSLAYAKALAATDIETYITEECKVWSTGILKGQQVLLEYRAHKDLLV